MTIFSSGLSGKELIMTIPPNAKHETKVCPRCQSRFVCKVGDVANCQCSSVQLKEAAQKHVEDVYSDCLCVHCLRELMDHTSFQ